MLGHRYTTAGHIELVMITRTSLADSSIIRSTFALVVIWSLSPLYEVMLAYVPADATTQQATSFPYDVVPQLEHHVPSQLPGSELPSVRSCGAGRPASTLSIVLFASLLAADHEPADWTVQPLVFALACVAQPLTAELGRLTVEGTRGQPIRIFASKQPKPAAVHKSRAMSQLQLVASTYTPADISATSAPTTCTTSITSPHQPYQTTSCSAAAQSTHQVSGSTASCGRPVV